MRWHPEQIADAVRAELGRFGASGRLADITALWPELVGPAIAANAWPARRSRDGTLHVATGSSVWAFELTQLEAEIRKRLVEGLGADAPPRLRFAVGPLPERAADSGASSAPNAPKVSADDRVAGQEVAAPIENEGLRRSVARAAAASLALARERVADRPLW